MTRGLYPPDTLSDDDIKTMRDLRRDIYSSAVVGAGFGTTSGFVLHTGMQWAKRYGLWNAKLNKNTAMLTVLGCGALGMFLSAAKTGKEGVHNLHPIFQIGAVPPPDQNNSSNQIVGNDKFDYRQTVQQAQQQPQRNSAAAVVSDSTQQQLDIDQLKQAQLLRRQSVTERIKMGSGISDSHGGKWYTDDDDDDGDKVNIDQLKQNQVIRRQSLTERIQKGQGLSDSHGGHQWFRENK